MVMQSVKLATHPCQCFPEATSAVASLPAAKQGTELQLPSLLSMCPSGPALHSYYRKIMRFLLS